MDEKIVESSMQIILSAGDARIACREALEAIVDFDFDLAQLKMEVASKNITQAHKIQTDCIQAETRGEVGEYSLLFAHAQDTLMTIYSEINIAKQLIRLTKSLDERIKKLER